MPIRVLKFLSRVYECDLKHIEVDELSDELQENFESKSGKILIV